MKVQRKCSVCRKPIDDRNQSGICRTTEACRRALRARQPRPEPAKSYVTKGRMPLPEVYDDEGELIVDDVAIALVVHGIRPVDLTETERRIAIFHMVKRFLSIGEISRNMGLSSRVIKVVLAELGYEVIADHMSPSFPDKKIIVPCDRPKGPKILSDGDHHDATARGDGILKPSHALSLRNKRERKAG